MLTSMASALLTKSRPRILEALLAHVAVCARALHKPCRGAKWISEDHSAGAAGVTRGPFCGRGCWQDASVDLIGVREDIRAALADGRPVVALESRVIVHGLPSPANLHVAHSLGRPCGSPERRQRPLGDRGMGSSGLGARRD